MQYRVIALATISLLLLAAGTTMSTVYAAEPTVKQGRQIVRSGDNPIIITGPINPGPARGGPPECVEPFGCPPPPRDNAKVQIPNIEIQQKLLKEGAQVHHEQQQPDPDEQTCIGCDPKKSSIQQGQGQQQVIQTQDAEPEEENDEQP